MRVINLHFTRKLNLQGKARLVLWGLGQALATILLCALAVAGVAQLQRWESPRDGYLDKIALLLLLVVSALVSATFILAGPAYLTLRLRVKEGFLLLLTTVAWLIVMLGLVFVAIVFLHVHTLF